MNNEDGLRLKVSAFIDKDAKRFSCSNCLYISVAVVKLTFCSHLLCKPCFQKRFTTVPVCPICGVQISEDVCSDEFHDLISKILNLTVHCTKNCGICVPMSDLKSHLLEECPNGKISCTNEKCGKLVKRKKLQEHLQVCDHSYSNCPGCGITIKLLDLHMHEKVHHCLSTVHKQMVMKQVRNGVNELKHQQELLRVENYKTKVHERNLEKHYIVERVKRNPTHYSTSLVFGHSLTSLPRSSSCSEVVLVSDGKNPHEPSTTVLSNGKHMAECVKCGNIFVVHKNHSEACSWHNGPILKVFGGMCKTCGRLSNLEGCYIGPHIAKA